MAQAVKRLGQSYLLVALAALLFGLLTPKLASLFLPYTTIFLGVIFFLTALKINLKEIILYLRDWRMVVETNFLMLIVIPVMVYYLLRFFVSELALPFFILAAMPTAMAAPLIAELMGGRQSLALLATATTSLLAPLTVPFLIKFFAGAQVQVSFIDMFLSLTKVIFIPFILAEILKYTWPRASMHITKISPLLSVTLLGLIIAAVSSRQAEAILKSFSDPHTLTVLVSLFILFAFFHWLGYTAIFWRSSKDRFTISICLTYMNFLLAIYLVDNFFPEPAITLPIILSVVPWTIFLPVSGLIAKKWLKVS